MRRSETFVEAYVTAARCLDEDMRAVIASWEAVDLIRIAELLPGSEKVFQMSIFLLFYSGHAGSDRVAMGFETAVSHLLDGLRINGSPSDFDAAPRFPAVENVFTASATSTSSIAQPMPGGGKDRDTHTGDARNPYAIFRSSYRGMNNWIRRNNNPCIEKPNSLQPVESAAILHNLSIACVEALQGGGLFELKDFQELVCFESIQEHGSATPAAVLCKPAPEAFDAALRLARVASPREAVFIDDSTRNIKAARDKGILTVLVGHTEPHEDADYVVRSVHELPRVLPELFGHAPALLERVGALGSGGPQPLPEGIPALA